MTTQNWKKMHKQIRLQNKRVTSIYESDKKKFTPKQITLFGRSIKYRVSVRCDVLDKAHRKSSADCSALFPSDRITGNPLKCYY